MTSKTELLTSIEKFQKLATALANCAAGVAVGKVGTSAVSTGELLEAIPFIDCKGMPGGLESSEADTALFSHDGP